MTSKTFEDIEVWKKAHAWVLHVYRFTEQFPKHEVFGLIAQLRRAAISIPANIAEGFKRKGRADKARFYNIAQGSLEECRYYMILARDLGYGNTAALLKTLEEVGRMLEAYSRSMLATDYWLLTTFLTTSPANRQETPRSPGTHDPKTPAG